MNEQSLRESNAILSAAVQRTEVGGIISASPADLANEIGLENRLAVARAIRALMSRGRIAQEGDSYRLVDTRPLEPGEQASVKRPVRRRRRVKKEEPVSDIPTYEQVGRLIIDRLIELSAQVAELRTTVERSKREAEASRREALESTRTASAERRHIEALENEVAELRRRLEMSESNLRAMVQAAHGGRSRAMGDADQRAILDILSSKDAVE